MKETLIPLVWDSGQIGSVAVDKRGILRLRHAVDEAMTREVKCPGLLPPYHLSPAIDAADVGALLEEFEWHSK